jgi:hypothetical protein
MFWRKQISDPFGKTILDKGKSLLLVHRKSQLKLLNLIFVLVGNCVQV